VLDLEAGVNMTIGLDVIRSSVDHGAAFYIAGKGIADERGLLEALRQGNPVAHEAAELRRTAGGLLEFDVRFFLKIPALTVVNSPN